MEYMTHYEMYLSAIVATILVVGIVVPALILGPIKPEARHRFSAAHRCR